MAKLAAFLVVAFLSQVLAAPASKIHPNLQGALLSKAPVDILISFVGGTGKALSQIESQSFATRSSRLLSVTESLQRHAAASQETVLELLNQERSTFEKMEVLWVSNQIYVQGALAHLVQALTEFEQVELIKQNERIPLDQPTEVLPGRSPREIGILAEWGVEAIRAHQVHAAGTTGEGVRICTIDTGVRYTHEALLPTFLGGSFAWYDPYTNSATPIDQNGHGTHTTGNIAGIGGIGVAHGAKWQACRGCDSSTCGNAQLLSCAQWTLCPDSGVCSFAPHLVSNSWGGGRGNTFYDAAVQAWHAGRIIPLFSNGNSGPGCNTANSPADSQSGVMGIGSTTNTGALSSFSSRGATAFGTIKPDVSAPGSSINSAYNTGDTAYAILSGTSMSCPHAAGAVALLLSKNPNLTYAQITNLIYTHANRNVIPTGLNCGGISDNVYPNHSFGHGIVDVKASFDALVASY